MSLEENQDMSSSFVFSSSPSIKYKNSHKERMTELFTSGLKSDLTLILLPSGEVKIPVHRAILIAGSPVFYKLLEAQGDEHFRELGVNIACEFYKSEDPNHGEWETTVFRQILLYLYTGEQQFFPVPSGCLFIILELATRFELQEIMDSITNTIVEGLEVGTALGALSFGMKIGNSDLINKSLDFVCNNGSIVIKLQEFERLEIDCLIEIVKQDNLEIDSEVDLFKSVWKWGEAELKRQGVKDLSSLEPADMRQVLNKILKWIRFPIMSQREFVFNVATKNILSSEEILSMLIMFSVTPEERTELPEGRFISTPRSSSKKKNNAVNMAMKLWHQTNKENARDKAKEEADPIKQLIEERAKNIENDKIYEQLKIDLTKAGIGNVRDMNKDGEGKNLTTLKGVKHTVSFNKPDGKVHFKHWNKVAVKTKVVAKTQRDANPFAVTIQEDHHNPARKPYGKQGDRNFDVVPHSENYHNGVDTPPEHLYETVYWN